MDHKRVEINILTSVHRAVDIRIFHKQAASLARAGYQVKLFAQEHPDASIMARQYNITYVPLLSIDKRRQRGKVWLNLMELLKQMPGDIWHFHDPELLPLTIIWKKMFAQHVSLIYDVHEDMPLQVLSKEWIPTSLRKATAQIAGRVEKRFSNYVQAIVTATPDIANNFVHDNKVVVHNHPFLPKHSKESDILPYLERDPIVVYTGGLTKMQGIFEMLSTIDLLPESLKVKFHVAGKYDPSNLMDQLVTTSGWKHTHYHGVINRDEVMELMNKARVGLIIDHPIPNYIRSLSTKMFEYMSAGIPIIASNFPLWASIVNKYQCGLLVDPYNPQDVADAILWILEHPDEAMAMGKRGQKAILEEYNWERESNRLLGLYEAIISQ
ncbi:glycosyltransferase family 4 protein [Anabaena azotica]|uniref:glycosyltransferase family 4 protein n=1 Tax=Anabaena azotica TaxID=197653 RepID=UPI0039A5E0D6